MPNVLNRIASESQKFYQRVVGNGIGALKSGFTGNSEPSKGAKFNAHSDADLRDMMLAGTIYRRPIDGGALPDALRLIGRYGPESNRYTILPHYNPVPSIVSFYRNSFGGRLGNDITFAEKIDGRPIDPRAIEMIGKVWQWSNLDHRADEFTAMAANQGRVGIRIGYSGGQRPRVYLDFDDIRTIQQVDRDDRGNVVNVYLRYFVRQQDAKGVAQLIEAREVISKDGFSLTYGGEEQLTPEQQENPLGVCPYVICDHDPFSRHAYHGSEEAIHAINFAISNLDDSTLAHVWPLIFSTSAAAIPTKLKLGRATLMHSQNVLGQPASTFDPLVPDIDYEQFINQVKARVDFLRERQPQLILNNLSLLSGVSGESLAQCLKPAEAEAYRARTVYEDAIRRALQIAMSVGIVYRVPGFDLGTGTGSAESAERAYADGNGPEAFAFAARSPLPLTVYQQVQQATADQAEAQAKLATATRMKSIGLPDDMVWAASGLSEDQIKKAKTMLRKQVTLPADEEEVVA